MNKNFLVLGLVAGVVVLLSLVFAVSSFFYFKGKAIAPSCLKDGSLAETNAALEALEECLLKSSSSQEIVVATSSALSVQLNKQLAGVEIGSKMFDMTVKGSLDETTKKEIIFSGKTRITGDYWYADQGEYDGGWACFSNLDSASEAKMPKFPGSEKAKSDFCIPSSDLLQNKLISVATSGRATIDIDNFNLVYCECGAWSNAELVDVVAIEKK